MLDQEGHLTLNLWVETDAIIHGKRVSCLKHLVCWQLTTDAQTAV